MIYRTLSEAQHAPCPGASWKQRAIVKVQLANGQVFWRDYTFNTYTDKCKRCRKAKPQGQGRIAATGHTCTICGNPFGAFVRQGVSRRSGQYETLNGCWSSSGRLH